MHISVKKVPIITVMGAWCVEGYKLDPITITLEGFPPEGGRLTVQCYGDAWSHYWSHMGCSSLVDFLLTSNVEYITRKMWNTSMKDEVLDVTGTVNRMKAVICENRLGGYLSKDKARDLWDSTEDLLSDHDEDDPVIPDVVAEVFGGDWWESLEYRKSDNWVRLETIVTTVKEALQMYKDSYQSDGEGETQA